WFGMNLTHRILIIDYIGPSLEDIVKHKSHISFDNMMKISLKLVDLIENLHTRNVIHRDIKPENFLINRNNQIYMIDFGLSRIYKNIKTNEHI
ncbi:protein kinase domain-containing protein, partial [Klebsiella pneumoniae]|uniref:protein kinase domain-containing protein n=1 Tax=Klebsiella pneumoniae TaxID=573 RepID=UPI00200C89B8